ncbi:MAG: short-subunit dehydrogenase, partial [Candidatus Marivariicella framensis]
MNKSKKAIIVGASSGIGKALARELVKNNYSVGITGRRDELLLKLQKEHPEQIHYATSDCTKSNALEDIEKLTKELGGLDLFIISAGRGTLNLKLDFDLEDKINKLNVIAFTSLVN